MKLNIEIIKRHPYISGGVILFGGLAVWFFFLRGSSANSGTVVTTGSGVNPAVANQTNAQLTGQAAQISYELAAQLENDQTNLAALTAQLQVKANEDTYSFQIGSQQLDDQTKIALAQLTNQADIAKQTLDAKLADDKLSATLQQNLATINAQLTANVSAIQSQNYQSMLNQQMEINGQNDNVTMNASNNNEKIQTNQAWANVAGMAVMAFL